MLGSTSIFSKTLVATKSPLLDFALRESSNPFELTNDTSPSNEPITPFRPIHPIFLSTGENLNTTGDAEKQNNQGMKVYF